MNERRPELVIELGEPVLDAIDTEARRLSVVEDRCVEGGHAAAVKAGHDFMAGLLVGLGTLEPKWPVAELEPAKPKRRRRKPRATTQASGDAA